MGLRGASDGAADGTRTHGIQLGKLTLWLKPFPLTPADFRPRPLVSRRTASPDQIERNWAIVRPAMKRAMQEHGHCMREQECSVPAHNQRAE